MIPSFIPLKVIHISLLMFTFHMDDKGFLDKHPLLSFYGQNGWPTLTRTPLTNCQYSVKHRMKQNKPQICKETTGTCSCFRSSKQRLFRCWLIFVVTVIPPLLPQYHARGQVLLSNGTETEWKSCLFKDGFFGEGGEVKTGIYKKIL